MELALGITSFLLFWLVACMVYGFAYLAKKPETYAYTTFDKIIILPYLLCEKLAEKANS